MESTNLKNKTILESLIEMNHSTKIYKKMHEAGYPGYAGYSDMKLKKYERLKTINGINM